MAYKFDSTENPLGHRPWSFATSNSGLNGLLSRGSLGIYDQANFVIPTNTVLSPAQTPRWIPPGMGRYTQAKFAEPSVSVGNPLDAPRWTPNGMGKYYAQNFVIPPTGMGDYEVDPATLPAPPAGEQYNAQYQLVPIPQTNYRPWILLGLLAAGGAAYYFYTHQKTARLKLPVVTPQTAGVKL